MSESPAAPAGAFPVPGLRPPTQRTGAKRRIGDVIVQLGFAERELVEKAVEKGRAGGVPLGQSLIDAGIVDSNQLAQALAERNGLDYVDLNSFEVDQGAANLIDAAKARRYQTIPISFLGEQTVLVATADPANVLALDDIAMATGYEVRRAVASPEDIDGVIDQLSRLGDAVEEMDD
jgi:type IV pilus assembly protein PilB